MYGNDRSHMFKGAYIHKWSRRFRSGCEDQHKVLERVSEFRRRENFKLTGSLVTVNLKNVQYFWPRCDLQRRSVVRKGIFALN
jgi:hypothetical protein